MDGFRCGIIGILTPDLFTLLPHSVQDLFSIKHRMMSLKPLKLMRASLLKTAVKHVRYSDLFLMRITIHLVVQAV